MAITQTNFKTKVAAYINRQASELVVNGFEFVTDAMNMAKLGAQRRHNFKMNRATGFISTSLSGAAMSTITSDKAGVTPMTVKYIEAMWTFATNGSINYRSQRIPARTLGDEKLFHSSINNYIDTIPSSIPPASPSVAYLTSQTLWWQQGLNVYVSGVTAATQYMVDVVQYLPDYDGTVTTNDFFLTYHHDWLFLATLDYMNLFLKEDARIEISSKKMEETWNSVVSYDEQFSEGAFDLDMNN